MAFNYLKVIPICGVSIISTKDDDLKFFNINRRISGKGTNFKFTILSKENFYNLNINEFYNKFDSDDFDSVIIYNSLNNNYEEINYIKIALTAIYLAHRSVNEHIENESNEIFRTLSENFYKDKNNKPVLLTAPIKIGPFPLDKNDFNESINRLYGVDLFEEFKRHDAYLYNYTFRNTKLKIKDNDEFRRKLNCIFNYLNNNPDKAIFSAFRLYFDTISTHNVENSIINISTIFEVLLLKKDEDNQRKKVSVRAACLLCDSLGLAERKYISDLIYQFYKLRNRIVHDGYSYIDLEETIGINLLISSIRNILYLILKYIIEKDIKNVEEIKSIVSQNINKDKFESSFEYISLDVDLADIISRLIQREHDIFLKYNLDLR